VRADDATRTERIDILAAYFRTNLAHYTSEALRKAAADAGHEPLDIAAAWAVAAEPPPTTGRASLVPPLITIAYFLGTYAIAAVIALIPQTSGLAAPVLGALLALGILAWLMFRESRPAVANAFKIGVILAIVVPLVLALAALGVCLVLLAGLGGS
jgi:hypothetical protein